MRRCCAILHWAISARRAWKATVSDPILSQWPLEEHVGGVRGRAGCLHNLSPGPTAQGDVFHAKSSPPPKTFHDGLPSAQHAREMRGCNLGVGGCCWEQGAHPSRWEATGVHVHGTLQGLFLLIHVCVAASPSQTEWQLGIIK